MHTTIHQRPPHLHEINLHLLHTPPQTPHQTPKRQSFGAVVESGAFVETDHTENAVARPGPDGAFVDGLLDIGEAGGGEAGDIGFR